MTVLMRKGENLTRLGDRQVERTFTDHPWGHSGKQRKGMKLCCDFTEQALGSQNTTGNCSRFLRAAGDHVCVFPGVAVAAVWQI